MSDIIQGAEGVHQSTEDDRNDREKRQQREEEKMDEDVHDHSHQNDDLDVCIVKFWYIIFTDSSGRLIRI